MPEQRLQCRVFNWWYSIWTKKVWQAGPQQLCCVAAPFRCPAYFPWVGISDAHLSTLIWDVAALSTLITHEHIQQYWAAFSSEGYVAKEHVAWPNLYTTPIILWTLWWNVCNLASRSNPSWATINIRLAFRMGFYGLVLWMRPALLDWNPEKR